MSIVDVVMDNMLTEWLVVEVTYPKKSIPDGDIAIANVCTEGRIPPKEVDNSRGFTVVYPAGEYERAKKYCRKISEELGIKSVF